MTSKARSTIGNGRWSELKRPALPTRSSPSSTPASMALSLSMSGRLRVWAFRLRENSGVSVRLASQRNENFLHGRGSFIWLGEQKTITAFVLIEAEDEHRARKAGITEEEILIGTELLSDCRLQIDFVARKVLISKVV
jgi:hypothetical protein